MHFSEKPLPQSSEDKQDTFLGGEVNPGETNKDAAIYYRQN